jgi:hypothetical protein
MKTLIYWGQMTTVLHLLLKRLQQLALGDVITPVQLLNGSSQGHLLLPGVLWRLLLQPGSNGKSMSRGLPIDRVLVLLLLHPKLLWSVTAAAAAAAVMMMTVQTMSR